MSPPEHAESRTGHDTGRLSRNFSTSVFNIISSCKVISYRVLVKPAARLILGRVRHVRPQ